MLVGNGTVVSCQCHSMDETVDMVAALYNGRSSASITILQKYIDATGEYADLALEHDRLIREKIPSIIYRYKLVDGKPYIAHVIEVDTEANEAPHLIVYDISRTIIISWKVGVEAIDKILQSYAVMQDSEIAWLYVPLDLYTNVKPETESWNILERTIKGNEGKLMTVLTTRKFNIGMVQRCLHMTKNKLLEDSK